MVTEAGNVLAVVGLIIFCGYLATVGFRRFRTPDILFLILLGVLIGPTLNLLSVEDLRAVAPIVSTLAIVLILFDGGLEIKLQELRHGVAQGSALGLIVFSATALLCAFVAHMVGGITPVNALMLGMALGGAGVVIVLPLIQQMGASQRAVTVVSLEAAVSDVLVVVGVHTVAVAIALKLTDPINFTQTLLSTFAIALIIGPAAGFGWARLLPRVAGGGPEYMLTLAALFIVHAATEFLGGSGPIAVLGFGLVLGNSQVIEWKEPELSERARRRRKKELVPVFGAGLQGFHQEMVFFIRTFFFVLLGIVLDLDAFRDSAFLLVGVLLTLAVVAGRWFGVHLLFRRSALDAWDRKSIELMFPLGLAAAALSLVPFQTFAIPGTEDFGSYAAVVIVLTNALSSGLVFFYSRRRRRADAAATPTPA